MKDRNNLKSILKDIVHLETMADIINSMDKSSADTANLEYLRQLVVDWLKELNDIKCKKKK